MKKTLAFVLTFLMLLTLAVPALGAEKQGSDIPNIYLQGQGEYIYLPDGTPLFDGGDLPDGFLSEAVQGCMPYFKDAIKNDDEESWAAYREKFMEYFRPVFCKYALDKNGEASDNSDIRWQGWKSQPNTDEVRASKFSDGTYRFRSFNFYQDWRRDPIENAGRLNTYIENVKIATGSAKVNLIGRCEGANVILAYLAEYGYGSTNCVELYVQSANGVDLENALFANKMEFDGAALRRFKETNDLYEDMTNGLDQTIVELIDAALEMTSDTMLLDAGLAGIQALAPKIYKELIVYVLRESYGTMPGIWSLVGPDYYQDARKGVFSGYEEKYACLLEKLDNYDAKVRQRLVEIIDGAVAAGVKVANFPKYGDFQVQPICDTNNEIGDNSVSLKFASFGATTAKYGSTLSDKYIANAKKNGTDKYISPDKMVDASTVPASIRDTTWFIYGSEHRQFPDIIHEFMFKFLKADGNLTVFNDESAPQYMVYSGSERDHTDTIVPMKEENAATLDSGNIVFKNVNWKDMFMRFFKTVLNFLKAFLAKRSAA